MQPFSGNQHPDPLISLMNMSLALRLPRSMHLSRSSSNVPCLPLFLEMLHNPHVFLTRCTIPCPCHTKRRFNVQKCSEPISFFTLLTSKCALHHNGVHFLKILTSKSDLNVVCFVHFDFEMCFVLQQRALSTSQLPKVLQTPNPDVFSCFTLLASKCASRKNSVIACNFASPPSGQLAPHPPL